jgi:hypothetical protein
MNFKDAASIWQAISSMQYNALPRNQNRARIDAIFNGNPPYTPAQAKESNITTNVNPLVGTRVIHGARGMMQNALLKPENRFTCTYEGFKKSQRRTEWQTIVTTEINRKINRRRQYSEVMKSQIALAVLHGIGPVTWQNDDDWCPMARGMDDILIPSRTLVDLSNLDHFAIFSQYTAAQLMQIACKPNPDKAWNMPAVRQVLEQLKLALPSQSNNSFWNRYQFPEKFEEDIKENSGLWGSDSTPVVNVWECYFLNTDLEQPCWNKRIILDVGQLGMPEEGATEFLFNPGDRNYGNDISRIMHPLIADGSVVGPFRWHSVRSLGFLLYSVCHLYDRMFCKFSDASFESMLWYFRLVGSGDRERLQKVDLHDKGVIPDGLSWVKPEERPTVNYEVINGAMAMYRQLIAESSASFVQNPNDGTQKEMTAHEVIARVQSSNALVGSMLSSAYEQITFQYREILRRFFTTDHPDCVEFRGRCIEQGVPKDIFKLPDQWDVQPERVMGNGNKMLEMAQADKLMAIRTSLAPASQQEVLHMYVEANTDDPKIANRLVPLDGSVGTPSAEKASFAWGTITQGLPVQLGTETNYNEYVEQLIKMMGADIAKINQQQQGVATEQQITGLVAVNQYVQSILQVLEQDVTQKQKVKQYQDALGKAMNQVKAYSQRLAEQQQAQAQPQQPDPQAVAKAQGTLLQAKTKAQIDQAKATQKMAHQQQGFVADQQRKNVQTAAEIRRKGLQTQADLSADNAEHLLSLTHTAQLNELDNASASEGAVDQGQE